MAKVIMKRKYLKLLPLTLGYKTMLIFLSQDSILLFLLQRIASTQHVPGTLAEKGWDYKNNQDTVFYESFKCRLQVSFGASFLCF